MFHHIVMMRLAAHADAAFHARVEDYARRIRSECAGLVRFEYVSNLADRAQGYGHAVLGAFASSAAHDAYQVSPAHQELKAFVAPYVEDLVVCDADVPAPSDASDGN